jgi:hypothetical protein
MRLTRYLNELFDTDIPVKVAAHSSDEFITKFKIGDIEYTFEADYDSEDGEWYVSFTAGAHAENITGTGKAAQVYAGVIKSFKMFIKLYRPAIFEFHAKERSRIKLYDRLAKMIKGYKLTKSTGEMGLKYSFKKPKRKVKKKKIAQTKARGSIKTGLKPL